MSFLFEQYKQSADFIAKTLQTVPDTVVVLGSGLGDFAKELENPVKINYRDIPHFPDTTVESHKGILYCGEVSGKRVLVMQGRFHYYEGYTMQQAAYWVRVLKLLGVSNAIITNAAGAINPDFGIGDFMLILDHIKLCAQSPTAGVHDPRFGQRFFDMTNAYTPQLLDIARSCAGRLGISLREGVYAYMTGPQFETPAEIRALRVLGADAVGMSTVPEVIAAAQCGIRVLGLSCLTNMAAGVSKQPVSDQEVIQVSAKAGKKMFLLIKKIIKSI